MSQWPLLKSEKRKLINIGAGQGYPSQVTSTDLSKSSAGVVASTSLKREGVSQKLKMSMQDCSQKPTAQGRRSS